MVVEIDHYIVLGLPSGEEGAKLSDHEIHKAFKTKALLLHPDKSRRRDDPNAHANFLKLQNSYQLLKDGNARKSFDDLLRIEKAKKDRQRDCSKKRQRMISDLVEEEERYYRQRDSSKRPSASNFGVDLSQEEEERYSRTLNEEIERIIARHYSKQTQKQRQEYATDDSGGNNYNASSSKEEYATYNGGNIDNGLDCREKVVKVSWEKTRIGEDYTAQRLYEIFGKYGCVEDVVIRRKKGSALVVMASKDAAIAIATAGYGLDDDGSNPLRVEFLQPGECAELGNIVGAGYRDYEKSVLEKMRGKASKLG